MRAVLHAGFHKTGTTSVQTTLSANRALLAPHLRVFLKAEFETLTEACRAASLGGAERDMIAITEAARAFAATLDPDDPRPVLMASEDLSGVIPGRRGITGYGVAPDLMRAILAGLAVGRPGIRPALHFTLRRPDAWLRSVWWQNLRSTRLRTDLRDFSADLEAGADLARAVRRIAAATAPVPVTWAMLEDSAALPLGPLDPLLDAVGLPDAVRAALVAQPRANASPDMGLPQVFLALNRSGLDDKPVREAKKLLRRAATRQAGPT